MARKGQSAVQEVLTTDEAFDEFLEKFEDILICMEVYSEFCGYCVATSNAIRKGKMEIGMDRIAMGRAQADTISYLERFRNNSEPIFLFIMKRKITDIVFGPNGVLLLQKVEEQLEKLRLEQEMGIECPKHEITEMLPEEVEKFEYIQAMEREITKEVTQVREVTKVERKKRINMRIADEVRHFNYILFLPHCHQAYYDLYELLDSLDLQVVAKEEVQLTEESLQELLYEGDLETNEACLHALMKGHSLIVMFKMGDTDGRDFVKLLRNTLYHKVLKLKESASSTGEMEPPLSAFMKYSSISKTKREVRRDRFNIYAEQKFQEYEERQRLKREQERMRREAEEERRLEEKRREEEEALRALQASAGGGAKPEATEEEPPAEEVEGETVEQIEGEAPDEAAGEPGDEGEPVAPVEEEEEEFKLEEFHSEVSIEDEEYIPPAGLFVPGIYCPPNDLARANGLAYFFPSQVSKHSKIESAILPPHVLLLFTADKRHDVMEVVNQFHDDILNVGMFTGDHPADCQFIAYSVKQYDKMHRPRKHLDRLALQVCKKTSFALLQLGTMNPIYISADLPKGEDDCLKVFPIGYGDDYVEEESVKEEEIVVAPAPAAAAEAPAEAAEPAAGGEEVEGEEEEGGGDD